MDLKEFKVNHDTHPYLARLVHCYQSHGPIPTRQELLDAQYQLWETEGYCTLQSLCEQVGVKYDTQDEYEDEDV